MMEWRSGVKDKFPGNALMAVFVAPMPQGIEVRGWPLLAFGGRNRTARIWDLHRVDAVGKLLIGRIERSGLTRAPPDAASTDSGRNSEKTSRRRPRGEPIRVVQ
jgi:hypothetical protein